MKIRTQSEFEHLLSELERTIEIFREFRNAEQTDDNVMTWTRAGEYIAELAREINCSEVVSA